MKDHWVRRPKPAAWRFRLIALLAGLALTTGLFAAARAGRAAQRGALGHLDIAVVRRELCAQVLPFAARKEPAEEVASRRLRQWVEGATVIGLGESTHGTHEFFEFKSRLIRLLVADLGVRTIAFEASWERASLVDRYVAGGPGDVRDVVARLGFWTWSTEEIVALVEWMRGFNEANTNGPRVRFVGFDPQLSGGGENHTGPETSRVRRQSEILLGTRLRFLAQYRRDAFMAENLLRIAETRPERAPVVAWAHNGHLARSWPYMGWSVGHALSQRYRAIALLTGNGTFSALVPVDGRRFALGSAPLETPPDTSIEGMLGTCEANEQLLFSAHATLASPIVRKLLDGRPLLRSLGAVAPEKGAVQFYPTPGSAFDAVWFSRFSTPSRVIPLPGMLVDPTPEAWSPTAKLFPTTSEGSPGVTAGTRTTSIGRRRAWAA